MSKTFKWCLDKNKLKTFGKQVFCVDGDGDKHWILNGQLHRENGPAIEYTNGYRSWCLNGKLHRENGPAVEFTNGRKWWYLHGKEYSESDYWKELKK